MNENNANLCEMEQEIFQIKDKYKPYFELRNAILCKAFFFTHWRRYKVPSASVLVQRK